MNDEVGQQKAPASASRDGLAAVAIIVLTIVMIAVVITALI